jgi:hypothetical protein
MIAFLFWWCDVVQGIHHESIVLVLKATKMLDFWKQQNMSKSEHLQTFLGIMIDWSEGSHLHWIAEPGWILLSGPCGMIDWFEEMEAIDGWKCRWFIRAKPNWRKSQCLQRNQFCRKHLSFPIGFIQNPSDRWIFLWEPNPMVMSVPSSQEHEQKWTLADLSWYHDRLVWRVARALNCRTRMDIIIWSLRNDWFEEMEKSRNNKGQFQIDGKLMGENIDDSRNPNWRKSQFAKESFL